MDKLCSQALSWGMPYDLFWLGAMDAVYHYSEKAKLEYELKRKELDLRCWLTGSYTREAILSIYQHLNPMAGKSAKQIPYPEKPRTMLREDEQKKSDEQKRKEIYDQFSAWAKSFKSTPKVLKGGKING